ncbi:hypothetical protein [Amycolatopsis vastitatis]|uniref:hypothetical protein n=1 Tax=Amycolatopsis vastitatis TaxID=1905142 RepID=UPI001177E165|nr:hypothetical protein [Amycolatopsis vastitatis]
MLQRDGSRWVLNGRVSARRRLRILQENFNPEEVRTITQHQKAVNRRSFASGLVTVLLFVWDVAVVRAAPSNTAWGTYVLGYMVMLVIPTLAFLTSVLRVISFNLPQSLVLRLADTLTALTRLKHMSEIDLTGTREISRFYWQLNRAHRRLLVDANYVARVLCRMRGVSAEEDDSSVFYLSRWLAWTSADLGDAFRLDQARAAVVEAMRHAMLPRPYLTLIIAEPPIDASRPPESREQKFSRALLALSSPLGLALIALLAAIVSAVAKISS